MIRADCNVFYYNKSKTEAAAVSPGLKQAGLTPAGYRLANS
jgi:hypothetical protein